MKINSDNHFWCLTLVASIMLSLIVLIFIAGFMSFIAPAQSRGEDEDSDSYEGIGSFVIFVLLSLFALIQWIRDKDRKIKDFFSGLLIVFAISSYFVFARFMDSMPRSWFQLPLAVIVFCVWVFVCFAFWAWLEHKIDPLREERERAKWAKIHADYIENERRYKAIMDGCEETAKMDAELDAIDAAIALERQAESLKRDGQKEGTEGVAADELGIYPTEAEIKAIRDEVRAHPVYQEAGGLKTGLVEDGITRLEELSRVDLYAELILLKWRMAEGGASADAINEAIDQWAEYHGIDDVTVEQQKLRQRGPSLKAIGEMPEGPAKEAALDEYATYKLQQELRDDAEKAMADVLEQYRIQAEKASKKITD